jgi:uncharacterized protein YbaR (Trm112 family)
MIARATFDAEVVAEWQRRRSAFRRSSRWVWWPFWLVVLLAPLPFILNVIDVKPGAFVVAFVLLFVGFHLRYRHLGILACPHCGKPPAPDRFGQMALGEMDCCPHCSYWFIDIRDGSKNA